jgi:hypothetical protein
MQLSEDCSREELIASEEAARLGIDNTPPAEAALNLKVLAPGALGRAYDSQRRGGLEDLR